jgi:hypothetical protein
LNDGNVSGLDVDLLRAVASKIATRYKQPLIAKFRQVRPCQTNCNREYTPIDTVLCKSRRHEGILSSPPWISIFVYLALFTFASIPYLCFANAHRYVGKHTCAFPMWCTRHLEKLCHTLISPACLCASPKVLEVDHTHKHAEIELVCNQICSTKFCIHAKTPVKAAI